MTASQNLHQMLIGQPRSRDRLNTPALILDLSLLRDNISKMASFARENRCALRPHAKAHKSADIARLLNEAGVVGHCCAKLGEAEALAAEGISNLLITSPIVTPAAIRRLVVLHCSTIGIAVVADHPDVVAAIAAAVENGPPLTVFVDVDTGTHRTGVDSAASAVALARQIAESDALCYGGLQFYCGTQQHIVSFAERRAAIAERTDYLRTIIAALEDAGLAPPVVTGGGTGSHRIDAELGLLTELQPGSYLLMDREYGDCDLDGSGAPAFATALVIDARIISANDRQMVTIDAGMKAFATDAGAPPILSGAPAGSRFGFTGDEHGAIFLPDGAERPALGSRVTLAAPHCDPTVNLYDAYHVVEGDTLVAIWPVTARGRSA